MTEILIVDDDSHIREVISFALEKANFSVTHASDGQQAVDRFQQSPFDLIVMDINMPEMDGLECCREIRKTSDIPILFLSSRDDEIDRILGLEIGGDDYVTKPFSPRELVARVKTILKRTQPRKEHAIEAVENKQLSHGLLSLNIKQHMAWWDDQPIALTAIEFSILAQMIKQPKHVYSRDSIMDGAYQHNIVVSDRTIDSHIRHIRQKFAANGCDSIILTQHGVGYKLSPCC
ncbi:MAG: two-component system response regulator CreB [Gammaproteobacteria bacterium]|nr:MAG: two-component system response regulator CreB [Gammaproteobacteria bacterium]